VEAVDPLGGLDRLEFRWAAVPEIAASEPANVVPSGFAAANTSLNLYNSLYWSKDAWARAPGDPAAAVITHWLLHVRIPYGNAQAWSDATPHSVKWPLENRVWYAYAGQTSGAFVGTHATPSVTARVLDDGTGDSMRRLLFTGAIAAVIYAVIAILIVIGSRFVAEGLWVPAVIYIGPALYFIGIVAMNHSAFGNIRSAALRWTALVGTCGVMTAVSTFLVFVLAVNVHLGLGGRL
jgi:hypothetical protein